jgi:formate-dependent nitrite reductase cytochrome c552 subunit
MSDHIGESNGMVCVHCGMPFVREQNQIQSYRCGSSYEDTFRPQWARSMTCVELQNGQLQERIKRLESAIDRASKRFFDDGSDGKVAAEMLTIMCGISDEKESGNKNR